MSPSPTCHLSSHQAIVSPLSSCNGKNWWTYRENCFFEDAISLSFPAHPDISPIYSHSATTLRTMAPSRRQTLTREEAKTHPWMGMPTFVHIPDGRRNPFIKLWKPSPAPQEEGPWSACKYMSLGLNKLHHYFSFFEGPPCEGTRDMLWYLSHTQYMAGSPAVSVSSAQANWPGPWPSNRRGVPIPSILFSYCLMIKITPAGQMAVNKNRKQPPD